MRTVKGIKKFVGVYRTITDFKFVLKVEGDDVYIMDELQNMPEDDEFKTFEINGEDYFWNDWSSLEDFHRYWGDNRVEDATLKHFAKLDVSTKWLAQ